MPLPKRAAFLLFILSAAFFSYSFAVFAQEGDIDPSGIAPQSCADLTANLRYSDSDSTKAGAVSALQEFLIAKGFMRTEATGFFGSITFASVKAYQTSVSLTSSGYVGPLTRAAIKRDSCGGATTTTTTTAGSATSTFSSYNRIPIAFITPEGGRLCIVASGQPGCQISVRWVSSDFASTPSLSSCELASSGACTSSVEQYPGANGTRSFSMKPLKRRIVEVKGVDYYGKTYTADKITLSAECAAGSSWNGSICTGGGAVTVSPILGTTTPRTATTIPDGTYGWKFGANLSPESVGFPASKIACNAYTEGKVWSFGVTLSPIPGFSTAGHITGLCMSSGTPSTPATGSKMYNYPAGFNVSIDKLALAGQPLPTTPTYAWQTWNEKDGPVRIENTSFTLPTIPCNAAANKRTWYLGTDATGVEVVAKCSSLPLTHPVLPDLVLTHNYYPVGSKLTLGSIPDPGDGPAATPAHMWHVWGGNMVGGMWIGATNLPTPPLKCSGNRTFVGDPNTVGAEWLLGQDANGPVIAVCSPQSAMGGPSPFRYQVATTFSGIRTSNYPAGMNTVIGKNASGQLSVVGGGASGASTVYKWNVSGTEGLYAPLTIPLSPCTSVTVGRTFNLGTNSSGGNIIATCAAEAPTYSWRAWLPKGAGPMALFEGMPAVFTAPPACTSAVTGKTWYLGNTTSGEYVVKCIGSNSELASPVVIDASTYNYPVGTNTDLTGSGSFVIGGTITGTPPAVTYSWHVWGGIVGSIWVGAAGWSDPTIPCTATTVGKTWLLGTNTAGDVVAKCVASNATLSGFVTVDASTHNNPPGTNTTISGGGSTGGPGSTTGGGTGGSGTVLTGDYQWRVAVPQYEGPGGTGRLLGYSAKTLAEAGETKTISLPCSSSQNADKLYYLYSTGSSNYLAKCTVPDAIPTTGNFSAGGTLTSDILHRPLVGVSAMASNSPSDPYSWSSTARTGMVHIRVSNVARDNGILSCVSLSSEPAKCLDTLNHVPYPATAWVDDSTVITSAATPENRYVLYVSYPGEIAVFAGEITITP